MKMGYGDSRPSDIVSGSFGTQTLTIPAGTVIQGTAQNCREVIIIPETSKTVYIGNSSSVANTDPVLPAGGVTLAIDNVDKLFFKGTSQDKVWIIWRS
jgi:hypothetical protein